MFRGAAETYADVLGEPGLAAYRELAEAEWSAVPALGPGDRTSAAVHVGGFGVTSMMESLARARGDVDIEIAVMSRDLSSAYDFLRIAQVCREHGRGDEALDWAERGVRAFPDDTHPGLREFLADAYLDRQRAGEAMALMWAGLAERPSIDDYERLKRYAIRVGEWPAWRPRALEEIRRSIATEVAAHRPPVRPVNRHRRHAWDRPPDGSLLVEILLREDELDGAWDAAAEFGCHRGTWLRLAHRSEEARPEDVVAVYRREVEALQPVTDKRVYAQVVDLLGRIGRLLTGLGRAGEFADYAVSVRAANGRRPAFLALYDAAGLPGPRPALRVIKGSPGR